MSNESLKQQISKKQGGSPVIQFRDFLEKGKGQIANALPAHLTPERMIRLACTEFSKNPALQRCNQTSVFGAIIQAAQLGLEIGVLGQAYLVPYKDTCTLIPGYKGLIALARRSGEVSSIETHIVYANDDFDLALGIDSAIKHKPYLDGDRGKPRLVYGVAKFRDGGHHMEWMSIDDIHKIRARSKASASGPWVTDYEQMVRKTVIRRMMNYLPMSIELGNALQVSDAADEGKRASIDGDFVTVVEREEPAEPAQTINADTGEIVDDPAAPEPDEYANVRMVIRECETISDIARLLRDLPKKAKIDLASCIRQRQDEIHAQQGKRA